MELLRRFPARNSASGVHEVFDKLIMVFKDGHYKVTELPEKLFMGPDLVYCGLPEREVACSTLVYTNRRGELI